MVRPRAHPSRRHRGAPRPRTAMTVPPPTTSTAIPSRRRSPTASSRPSSAWGASGAPSGCSGRRPGVYTTAVGYAGRHHAQPDLRGGLLRPHRPHRGRAGGVRPRGRQLRAAAARCSGRRTTRPRACARATTSARSTARPSTRLRRAAAGGRRGAPRRVPGAAHRGGLRRRSPPRSRRAGTFYYAEDYHQQYLAKNPNGYCGLGGTGMSCPIGVAQRRVRRVSGSRGATRSIAPNG